MGSSSCRRQAPQNPVLLPPSVPREQSQPLSFLISYCHLRYKAASVQPFFPNTDCPAERWSILSRRRETTTSDSTTPEEKPARLPSPTSQSRASDWNQQWSSYTADRVRAAYLLLLKRDEKKALTLQSGPKRSRPPGFCRAGVWSRGAEVELTGTAENPGSV